MQPLLIVKEISNGEEEEFLITDKEIGQGSYSKVYIAFRKEEYCKKKCKAEKICVKVLHLNNPMQLPFKQIQIEHQIMMRFYSRYVLRLIHCHQTVNNTLTEVQILYLFGQIAQGMLELKQNNVFHRDLKPSNILIKDGIIKITDFGLSKICDPLENSNTQVGTPYYMSPQALMSKNYNLEKNDVWAAGVILYQMLFAFLPWPVKENDTHKILLGYIQTHPLQFSSREEISEEIKDLIKNMLELEEENRFEWEEIMNMNIIRESQKTVCRDQIIALVQTYSP